MDRARRPSLFAAFVLAQLLGATIASRANAEPPDDTRRELPHAVVVDWRWSLAPAAREGVRVLDVVGVALHLGVTERFALVPTVSYGVSWGSPRYELGVAGMAFEWRTLGRRFAPRASIGAGAMMSAIAGRGDAVYRDSRRFDAYVDLRAGFDRMFPRWSAGLEARIAVLPATRLDVAGALDVGLAGRVGYRFGR